MSEPRPLRVLHLLAGSDAGGVSRYVRDLGDALTARGHRVSAAGRPGAWHELFTQANWPWIDAPLDGGLFALSKARRRLRLRVQADGGVDLIHAHYRKAALVGRKLAGDLGVPLLVSVHLTPIPLGPRRWLSEWGDHTLVASSLSRQWVIEQARVPAQRVTCIPHGVDPQRWAMTTRGNGPSEHRCLVYVGRFDEPKNEQWALDVLEAARQRFGSVSLHLMGSGPRQAELEREITRRKLSPFVSLSPFGDPLSSYRRADLLLLPSAREGFSLTCVEAMSVGTAVLRTDTAGAAEQITHGVTGFIAPVDRGAFVAAALAALSDPAALRRVGQAAAQHVRQNLSFQRQVDQTEALYLQLVGANGGSVRKPTP